MIIYLILFSLKTKFRNREYRRSLLAFGVLILYCLVFLSGYISKSITVLGSLLNDFNLTVSTLFLTILPFLSFVDLLIKLIFKNNSICILTSFQTRPISKKVWNIYTALCNVFTFWNFYLFILLSPYLTSFASTNEIVVIFVLLWASAILNNGICLWFNNYFSQLPIKTIIIGIFYLALLGGMYVFIRNNPFFDFNSISIALIIILVLFSIIHYLFLFEQKKIYITGSLVDQHWSLSKQVINISFLKLEFIYLFRSKRLITMFLLATTGSFLGLFVTGDRGEFALMQIIIVISLLFPSSILGQFLFAIEANFFNGIWTKPVTIMRLMEIKYVFFVIITGLYALAIFPFVLFYHMHIFTYFSVVLFTMFIFNLLLFPMALYAKRLDLNSSPFLNSQGVAKIPYFYVMLLTALFLLFLSFLYNSINNEWIFGSVVSAISLIFFFLRKQFLFIVCSIFIKWRHTIMNRYINS